MPVIHGSFRIRCNEGFSFCSILKQRLYEGNTEIKTEPEIEVNMARIVKSSSPLQALYRVEHVSKRVSQRVEDAREDCKHRMGPHQLPAN
jgi:hypothetical protein